MSVSTEEQRIRNLFERVETIEEVAVTLPQGDDRRARLLALSRDALAEEATVRPVIAAKILGLSEKTVRAWADAGLLATTQRSPRVLLDVPSVHRVSHVLRGQRGPADLRQVAIRPDLANPARDAGEVVLDPRPTLDRPVIRARRRRPTGPPRRGALRTAPRQRIRRVPGPAVPR